jgi:hypothetical protein
MKRLFFYNKEYDPFKLITFEGKLVESDDDFEVTIEPEICMCCGQHDEKCRSISGREAGWIVFCPKCLRKFVNFLLDFKPSKVKNA